jgi:hypothetical protein
MSCATTVCVSVIGNSLKRAAAGIMLNVLLGIGTLELHVSQRTIEFTPRFFIL